MRVKLIVTGAMERASLHRSLGRYFPVTGDGDPIEFLPPSMIAGPTSNPLPPEGSPMPALIRTFTTMLVATTLVGSERRSRPPDLVIGVDDLELANAHQPELVTHWVRAGIEDYFSRHVVDSRTEARQRGALRDRCSFHLLAPMPEAYFFGERAALTRTGVSAEVEACLNCTDLEAFHTDDPMFIPRLDYIDERRHPKRYLEHLLRRSGRPEARPYRETRDGVHALEQLAWSRLSDDDQTLGFARALFEDLADAFELENPLGDGALASTTHPRDRRELTLRNL
jgi:hypothetical protein